MSTSAAKSLGSKIRMLREVHNYTQEYIADVIDVSHNTYSLLEKGQAQFTIDRIEKIANFYKMDISDLMKLNDQNIIHSITHSNGNGICSENFTINNGMTDDEKYLYRDTIKRLEEQNEKLMKLIEKLTEKLS